VGCICTRARQNATQSMTADTNARLMPCCPWVSQQGIARWAGVEVGQLL